MSKAVMSAPTSTNRGATVLVVDDEPVICTLACAWLCDAGFRTLEAHNAREAIDLLENGEQVDVVFSDVQMPGIDGFELQRWAGSGSPIHE
jgi:CheY-like chemotaxis protein